MLKSLKHEKFAHLIAEGKGVLKSYHAAGFKGDSPNASRLRRRKDISERIDELLGAAGKKSEATIDGVVSELIKIAFADITQAVEWGEAIAAMVGGSKDNGDEGEPVFIQGVRLKASAELPPNVSAAISEVRKTKDGISIKFHDKASALEKLGRYLGMFNKDKAGDAESASTWAQLIQASYRYEQELKAKLGAPVAATPAEPPLPGERPKPN